MKGVKGMKAILIKILPATNTLGVRLKATTHAGSIIVPREYALNVDDQAKILAKTYVHKYGWPKVVGFGTLPNGDYVATLQGIEEWRTR